jgi:hypothetical protein
MKESNVGFNMAVAGPALIEGELDHVISASSTNEDYVLSSSGVVLSSSGVVLSSSGEP